MIKYSLKCGHGHVFESWFESADAFEKLKENSFLECTVCGSSQVEKSLMAPQVSASTKAKEVPTEVSELQKEIQALRKKVESTAENVGGKFANEARAMHYGEKPERAIYGHAKPKEALSLMEEGVPVAPLPWGHKDTH